MNRMRAETQAAVDALHAQIDALVEAEKAHHDKLHPNENRFWRHVAHTEIEVDAKAPRDREMLVWATASLPSANKDRA